MDCERFDKLLIDFVEGELERPEAEAALRHLAACPYCSRDVGEYKEIKRILEEESPIKASPELLARISAAARGELARERSPFWKKWFYSPILVPVLSSGLALFIWVSYEHKGLDFLPNGENIYSREVMAGKKPAPQGAILSLDREEKRESGSGSTEISGRFSPSSPKASRKEPGVRASAPESTAYRAQDSTEGAKEEDDVSRYEVSSSLRLESGGGDTKEEVEVREKPFSDVPAKGGAQTGQQLKATEEKNKKSELAVYREHHYAQLNLALEQQSRGNCEEAIKTNEELLKTSPPEAVQERAYLSLAECYEQKGEWSQAISNYDKLRRTAPDQANFAKNKIASIMQKSFLHKSEEDAEPEPGEESRQAE